MQGYTLLNDMAKARSDQDDHRPILAVCHSAGGIILKQALCIANEQLHKYEFLVNAIAGIIFVSTPHASIDKKETNNLFASVLKTIPRKIFKSPAMQNEVDNVLLWDLANRFEAIYFQTPVLSIFETKASKINEGRFRSQTQTVVDRRSCTTHAPIERFVGVHMDHVNTCHFQLSTEDSNKQVTEFLEETLQDAEQLISARLKALEFTYATVSSYSPTHSELALLEAEQTRPIISSVDATDGSSQLGFETVHRNYSMDVPRPKLRLPCIMLEHYEPNPSFSGRNEIMERLKKELIPSKNKVMASQNTGLRQFALCGFGGMGKTEIAQEFAWTHRNEFDAVFWVTADEAAKIDSRYQQICIGLGLEDQTESKSHVVSRELVKGWLSNPWKDASSKALGPSGTQPASDASWLIVFDNADDPMLLTDYWPQGNGSVLITSRDPLAKTIFSMRVSGEDLNPLGASDGASLLLRLTADSDSDEPEDGGTYLARSIVDALGGVPLAISQMAGIIRRQELTLREFFDLYKDFDEHAALHETKFDSITKSYSHSIATVWAIEKLRPESRKLLEALSFFDSDSIKEELIVELFAGEFSAQKDEYRKIRTELLQTSLIKRNKQNTELSIHRLVQDAVRAKIDRNVAATIFDSIVRLLWANWPSAMPKPSRTPKLPQPKAANKRLEVGRWPQCAALYPHVLKLHQMWLSMGEMADTTSLQLAALLNDAAWYQSERGRTRGFDGFFETAQTLCENILHDDKDDLLSNIYFCLGAIAADTNDHESSRKYKELSFNLQYNLSQELGVSGERLALAYSERSISRIQDGRIDEGIADLKREKEIRVDLGIYVPLSREANLGLAYLLKGEIDNCEKLLVDSLETRQQVLGKNDKESFRTGRILHALGNLRAHQGKLDESYACHQKAYEQLCSTIGPCNHRTADLEHRLAEHLIRLGKNEDAINTINTALKTWTFDGEVYKNELARTTFLKAKVLQNCGKDSKAAVAFKVACRLRREITKEKKNVEELTYEDFDNLVTFWSR